MEKFLNEQGLRHLLERLPDPPGALTMPTTGMFAEMTPTEAFQWLSDWLSGTQQPGVSINAQTFNRTTN